MALLALLMNKTGKNENIPALKSNADLTSDTSFYHNRSLYYLWNISSSLFPIPALDIFYYKPNFLNLNLAPLSMQYFVILNLKFVNNLFILKAWFESRQKIVLHVNILNEHRCTGFHQKLSKPCIKHIIWQWGSMQGWFNTHKSIGMINYENTRKDLKIIWLHKLDV